MSLTSGSWFSYSHSLSPGKVQLLVTVVQSYQTFWSAIPSAAFDPSINSSSSSTNSSSSSSSSSWMEINGKNLHATLMLVSWMLLFPLAILTARFYKTNLTKPFLGKPLWFTLHRSFTLAGQFFVCRSARLSLYSSIRVPAETY